MLQDMLQEHRSVPVTCRTKAAMHATLLGEFAFYIPLRTTVRARSPPLLVSPAGARSMLCCPRCCVVHCTGRPQQQRQATARPPTRAPAHGDEFRAVALAVLATKLRLKLALRALRAAAVGAQQRERLLARLAVCDDRDSERRAFGVRHCCVASSQQMTCRGTMFVSVHSAAYIRSTQAPSLCTLQCFLLPHSTALLPDYPTADIPHANGPPQTVLF